MEYPLTIEYSQEAVHDLETQEVILEETASLVHWMKATVGLFFPELGNSISPSKCQMETLVEAGDMLHMPTTWDWLYDDQGTLLLTMLVNAIGGPVAWAPQVILLLQNEIVQEALSDLPSQLPLLDFTRANKNISLIN